MNDVAARPSTIAVTAEDWDGATRIVAAAKAAVREQEELRSELESARTRNALLEQEAAAAALTLSDLKHQLNRMTYERDEAVRRSAVLAAHMGALEHDIADIKRALAGEPQPSDRQRALEAEPRPALAPTDPTSRKLAPKDGSKPAPKALVTQ
jgi:chromosome segregation ATPase